MENNNQQNNAPQNRTSEGSNTPKSEAQNERQEVKEGDPSQARPAYGSDAGPNTSSREDQLPSLNDGANAGADASREEDTDDLEEQQKGSDADEDQGGESSF